MKKTINLKIKKHLLSLKNLKKRKKVVKVVEIATSIIDLINLNHMVERKNAGKFYFVTSVTLV